MNGTAAPGGGGCGAQHWQRDPDLAGIRDEVVLAKLPATEREACQKLWADVAALLQRAQTKA